MTANSDFGQKFFFLNEWSQKEVDLGDVRWGGGKGGGGLKMPSVDRTTMEGDADLRRRFIVMIRWNRSSLWESKHQQKPSLLKVGFFLYVLGVGCCSQTLCRKC